MPRSGVTVELCPECETEGVHSVVIVGEDAFFCCQRCKAVRMEGHVAAGRLSPLSPNSRSSLSE